MAGQEGGGVQPHQPMQRPRWGQLWDHVRGLKPFAAAAHPWPGGEATGLRHPPERLIPGDPDFGHSLYAERKTAADLKNFAQLGWLKHLTASNKTLHAIYAAGLLLNWSQDAQHRIKGAEAAKALLALATDAPSITMRMRGFAQDFFPIVNRQVRQVFAWPVSTAEDKTLKGAALLSCTIAFNGLSALREPAAHVLTEGLDGVVQPDGGHISRNPEELLKLMLLLVPLRRALQFANDIVPPALHIAVERAMPMLRMLSHGDGGLPRFLGAKPNIEAVAAVLRTDQTMGDSLDIAPHSAIARMSANRLLLLADYGDAAMPIEASWRETRLFSCRSDSGRTLYSTPAEMADVAGGRILQMASAATPNSADISSTTRTIYLSEYGDDLRVEDQVPTDGFLMFSFADDVSVLDVGLTEVRLMAGDKSLWTIKQKGGLFEQGAEFQRTIKLEPDDPTKPATINWAVKKYAAD